jgi:hypothetical protein
MSDGVVPAITTTTSHARITHHAGSSNGRNARVSVHQRCVRTLSIMRRSAADRP